MRQAEIHVVLDTTTGVTVTGPLDNPLLCYGLLEAGKDVVRREVERRAADTGKGTIVVPDLIFPRRDRGVG